MTEEKTTNFKTKKPIPMKNWEIVFASEERITEFEYFIVKALFDIEALFISDKSLLNDFLVIKRTENCEKIPFCELSEDEKKFYPWAFDHYSEEDRMKLVVDYPPITDKEIEQIIKNERIQISQLIEQVFGISMNNYPTSEELYVWKVAKYIQKQTKQTRDLDKI